MIIINKKDLRKDILEKRSLLSKDNIADYSRIITDKIKNLDAYKNANRIMVFVSMESEVDTHPLIQESIDLGKSIVVPITLPATRELLLSDLFSLSELEVGDWNIEVPKKEFQRFVQAETVDLVIVPGVAFAKDGHRVGYGGGYYDRFLAKLDKSVPKVAIGFDLQVVERVPTNDFDIPVDLLLTENRTVKF